MAARIVVFGATGYTGRLTAAALAAAGHKPLLAGRSSKKLAELAQQLGGQLDTQVASSDDPASVCALLRAGDVLVSTVGPFTLHGDCAVEAAITQRAHYVDSTGEPGFIRRVFTHYGQDAARAGVALLTACGYDYIPGHLAAGLALERAGAAAQRVDIGYYMTQRSPSAQIFSQGTLASTRVAGMHAGMEWQSGQLVERFGALRVREFEVAGKSRAGISLGSSEHYALPSSYPQLQDINVYLGWYGKRSYMMSRGARALAAVRKLPLIGELPVWLASRGAHSQGEGPSAEDRASTTSHIVGVAYDQAEHELSRVELQGKNGYDFTAGILAWSAVQLAQHGSRKLGACGPIEAFGLEALRQGCAQAGISPGE